MTNSNNNNLFNGIDKTAPISDIAQQLLMRAFNIVQVDDDGDDDIDLDDDDDLGAVDIDLDDVEVLAVPPTGVVAPKMQH